MNTRAPLISFVIPLFNQWGLTRNCLTSLAQTLPGKFFEVICVDNGSTDDTATELLPLGEALFEDRFQRIRFEENQNFGPACNAGADKAQGRLLMLLNNDILLKDDWLTPLLKELEQDTKLGAVGPLLIYPGSERVQHTGIVFPPSLRMEHLYAQFPGLHPVLTHRRYLQAITGAAMLMERQLFLDCGGFYPEYKNGCEDLELCCRIRQKGKRLTVVPKSRLTHFESQTPGRFEHDMDNARLLNERCAGLFAPDLHKQARRDGFRMEFLPWLAPVLRPSQEQEQELNQIHNQPATATEAWNMSQVLEKHPLWELGYNLLARFHEMEADWEAASTTRFLHCHFFPTPANFAKLQAAATNAGRDQLSHQAQARRKLLTLRMNDMDGIKKEAAAMHQWAQNAGDEELGALYAAWMLKYNGR